jgi:hypothetical protein
VNKFITELLSPFAGRLMAGVSLASTLFWLVGLVVLWRFHPQPLPACPSGGRDLCGVLSGHWSEAILPGLLFFGGVFFISAAILTFPRWTLELLCGRGWWWRAPGRYFQGIAADRQADREVERLRHRGRWYPKAQGTADYVPSPGRFLEPTRLGNVFAATQQRILIRHGLRMDSCQWLLLGVMPAEKRTELEALSGAVLRRVHALEWFVLTTAWAFLLPGTAAKVVWVVVCLLAAHWAYREICRASGDYCEVLEVIVLTSRPALYRAVGFSVPKSTGDDRRKGRELSGYLDPREPVDVALDWPEPGA